jgi:hypothetical protein
MLLSPTSALERITDSSQTSRHVRKVPNPDMIARAPRGRHGAAAHPRGDERPHGPDREFASSTPPLRQVQRCGQPIELDEQGHRNRHGSLRPLRL